jgi:hypothetical protein
MSAFPKADVQNVRVGIELNVRFWPIVDGQSCSLDDLDTTFYGIQVMQFRTLLLTSIRGVDCSTRGIRLGVLAFFDQASYPHRPRSLIVRRSRR